MNTWNGIGNLTREPEDRSRGGVRIVELSVAINRYRKDGVQSADFIPVTVFGNRAEVCLKYLSKGSKVGISGSLKTDSYEGKDGKKHFSMTVVADEVTFLSRAQEGAHSPTPKENGFTEVSEDDLPF